MIRWNVRNRAEAKGWTNPSQFAKGARLTYPLASRLWLDQTVARIDIKTLETVAKALGVKNPLALLKHE